MSEACSEKVDVADSGVCVEGVQPNFSKEIDVGGIQSAVVEMHNEVFYFLMKWRVRDAILFHVDGHPDMTEGAPHHEELHGSYYAALDHASFLCPAVHHGMVSSIYWLNPHSRVRSLQDLGNTQGEGGRSVLRTRIDRMKGKIMWALSDRTQHFLLQAGTGKVVREDVVASELQNHDEKPLIADFDLDAFCCNYFVYWKEPNDDSIRDYRRRIDETISVLKNLGRKPNHIFIARTQGDKKWVPEIMVDDVQSYLLEGLRLLNLNDSPRCNPGESSRRHDSAGEE